MCVRCSSGDRVKMTSQSMMEFPEDGRAGPRPPGSGVAALLRTSDGSDQAQFGRLAADGDGPTSRRNSTSPPQTLSVRCAACSLTCIPASAP